MFSAWIPPNYIFRAQSVKSPQRITHDSVWGTLGTTGSAMHICPHSYLLLQKGILHGK